MNELLTPEAANMLYAVGVPMEFNFTHWGRPEAWYDVRESFEGYMKQNGYHTLLEAAAASCKTVSRETQVQFRVKSK